MLPPSALFNFTPHAHQRGFLIPEYNTQAEFSMRYLGDKCGYIMWNYGMPLIPLINCCISSAEKIKNSCHEIFALMANNYGSKLKHFKCVSSCADEK